MLTQNTKILCFSLKKKINKNRTFLFCLDFMEGVKEVFYNFLHLMYIDFSRITEVDVVFFDFANNGRFSLHKYANAFVNNAKKNLY